MISQLSNKIIFQVVMMPPFIAPKTEVKVPRIMCTSKRLLRNHCTKSTIIILRFLTGGDCCPWRDNQDSLRCSAHLWKFKMVSSLNPNVSTTYIVDIFSHKGGGRRVHGHRRHYDQDGSFRGEQKAKAEKETFNSLFLRQAFSRATAKCPACRTISFVEFVNGR